MPHHLLQAMRIAEHQAFRRSKSLRSCTPLVRADRLQDVDRGLDDLADVGFLGIDPDLAARDGAQVE